MTEKDRLIKARLAILILAAEIKNVAKVCKLAGASRSQFYAMKKAYETYGKEGLAPRARRKPTMPNRTPAAVEERILSYTRKHPTISYIRLAVQMNAHGVTVSPTTIRYVWQRHGLSTRSARLKWIKKSIDLLSNTTNTMHHMPFVPAIQASWRESDTGRTTSVEQTSRVMESLPK